MLKKFFKLAILLMMFIGIGYGILITIKHHVPEISQKEIDNKILSMIQTKTAEVTSFYTYGKAFNLKGKITNINKDNLESVKLVIINGNDYQKEYNLGHSFEESNLIFYSNERINDGIVIDELMDSEYYILLRLKLNNSIEPRYYSFTNSSNLPNINYYTLTKEGTNRKADIGFKDKIINKENYNLLTIKLEEAALPEEIYDIVIDAGHGGKDKGENTGNITEADVTLEYAKLLKTTLEEQGFKVKLTRDDSNTNTYTSTNMYDEDGRISIACKSKAKLMISFHINQGNNGLKGLEIYSPCNSNLEFAKTMANKIKEYSSIEYSNNNSFKEADGVYVRNFTKSVIKEFENTANKKGYEPYQITTNTPYLYTIREVGGIATGAYVDGRNTAYSENKYYKSNQGIECYQIELGYIKNDLDIITNEKANYIRAIQEAICERY